MKRLLSAAAGLLFATQASAAMITFDNFVYNNPGSIEVDWFVTINDDSAGFFTFDVGINAGSPDTADILGFGFDSAIDYSDVPNTQIALLGATTTQGGTNTDFSTANFNSFFLNPQPAYGFQIGLNGSGDGEVRGFSFTLESGGNTLEQAEFSKVAIRGQTAGPADQGAGGSVKDFQSNGGTNGGGNAVPELDIAGLPLAASLLAGIIGIGLERRRKKLVV